MATEQNNELQQKLKKGIMALAQNGITEETKTIYDALNKPDDDAFTVLQNVCNQLVDDCVRGLQKLDDEDNIKILRAYQDNRSVNGKPAGFLLDEVSNLADLLSNIRGDVTIQSQINMLKYTDNTMLKPRQNNKENTVQKYQNLINNYSSSQDQAKQHLDKLAECTIFNQYKSLLQQSAQPTVATSNAQPTDIKPEKTSLLSRLLGSCARSIANIILGVFKKNKVAPEPENKEQTVNASLDFSEADKTILAKLANIDPKLIQEIDAGLNDSDPNDHPVNVACREICEKLLTIEEDKASESTLGSSKERHQKNVQDIRLFMNDREQHGAYTSDDLAMLVDKYVQRRTKSGFEFGDPTDTDTTQVAEARMQTIQNNQENEAHEQLVDRCAAMVTPNDIDMKLDNPPAGYKHGNDFEHIDNFNEIFKRYTSDIMDLNEMRNAVDCGDDSTMKKYISQAAKHIVNADSSDPDASQALLACQELGIINNDPNKLSLEQGEDGDNMVFLSDSKRMQSSGALKKVESFLTKFAMQASVYYQDEIKDDSEALVDTKPNLSMPSGESSRSSALTSFQKDIRYEADSAKSRVNDLGNQENKENQDPNNGPDPSQKPGSDSNT